MYYKIQGYFIRFIHFQKAIFKSIKGENNHKISKVFPHPVVKPIPYIL